MQRQLLINQQEDQIKQLNELKKSVKKAVPKEEIAKKFKDIVLKELPLLKPKSTGINYYFDIIGYDINDPDKKYPCEDIDKAFGL
jgi:hypothetical protein